MYQQVYSNIEKKVSDFHVRRLSDGGIIPFDPANTDYANFKKEVLEGAELQDADGVVMSADAAKEFVRGLP